MMPKPRNRLSCESHTFAIGIEGRADHVITVNLGRDDDSRLWDVAFVESGKIGHGLHLLLADLGLKLSRILQSRDPETGAEAP